jgi:hypothetical protein
MRAMKAALLTASIVRREKRMFCKGLEREQKERALAENLEGGFYFRRCSIRQGQ